MKLEDINIRAAIEACVRVRSRELQITRKDVLDGFLDAVRASATATELVASWREIGRMIGAYEPEKSPTEKDITEKKEQLAELTDEELAKRASLPGEYKVLDFAPANAAPQK